MKHSLRTRYLPGTVLASIAGIALAASAPAQTAREVDEVVNLEKFEVTAALDSYRTTDASDTLKDGAPLRAAPFTVQVANAAFLADLRAETLADVYPYLTGLSANGTRADSFTLRGFDSNRESVQVDGLPGSTTVFGSPPSANIDRVEVLKGPASVLYGALAPGGIVNLVTKRPQASSQHEIFTSLRSYSGRTSSFGDDLGAQITLDSGGPLSPDAVWRYRLVTRYEQDASFRRNVDGERLLIAPSVSWHPSSDTMLLASLEWLDEAGRADAGLVAPGNDLSRVAAIDTRYQAREDSDADRGVALGLNLEHAFSSDRRLIVAWRSVWHDDQRTLYENNALLTVAGQPVLRRRYRDQYNERQYHFLDVRWQQEFVTGPVGHRLLFGVNGGREQRWFDRRSFGPFVGNVSIVNPQTAIPSPTPVPTSLRETWLENVGLYATDAFSWGDGWHGFLGLRHMRQDVEFDSYRDGLAADQSTSAFVRSAGLLRSLNAQWSVYLSYGESFVPASVEREDINGNTGIPPEGGRQWEGGVKFERPDGQLGTTLALFEITQFDISESLGVLNANGNTAFGLVGEARSRGAEAEVQWQPRPHIQIRAGYAHLAESDIIASRTGTQVGAPLTNAPKHQAHLWTRYNAPGETLQGWGAAVGLVGVSAREAVSTTVTANQLTLPGYVRADSALYYARGRTSVALNLQNAFDRAYFASASSALAVIPGEPRSLTLSLRHKF